MGNTNEKWEPEPGYRDSSGGTAIGGRFESAIRDMSRVFSVIAILAVIMLIAVAAIDVVGSKLFSRPLVGFVGLAELAQLIAMSFGMCVTFLGGHHIKVELLTGRVPAKLQAVIDVFVNFLGFALFVLIVSQMIALGRSFQISGEEIDQIYIPWYPFIYAVAVAFVPVCLALLRNFGNSLSGVVRR